MLWRKSVGGDGERNRLLTMREGGLGPVDRIVDRFIRLLNRKREKCLNKVGFHCIIQCYKSDLNLARGMTSLELQRG